MIFTTVGSQLPFDRLIKAVDQVVPELKGEAVVAQVGNSGYIAENIETFSSLPPKRFYYYFSKADLIIAHAGMGTVLSALEREKPIIIMPRLKKHGEHRTEHQMATAQKLKKLHYVYVAFNEDELQYFLLNEWNKSLNPLHKINEYASRQLLDSIEDFINS